MSKLDRPLTLGLFPLYEEIGAMSREEVKAAVKKNETAEQRRRDSATQKRWDRREHTRRLEERLSALRDQIRVAKREPPRTPTVGQGASSGLAARERSKGPDPMLDRIKAQVAAMNPDDIKAALERLRAAPSGAQERQRINARRAREQKRNRDRELEEYVRAAEAELAGLRERKTP